MKNNFIRVLKSSR